MLPITRPCIEDAALVFQGQHILEVAPWKDLKAHWQGPIEDLGERVLLPGLINPHTHLEYTLMGDEFCGDVGAYAFTDWVDRIVRLKSQWSINQFAQSWISGYQDQWQSGTTTLADTLSQFPLLEAITKPDGPRLKCLLEWIHTEPGAVPPERIDRFKQALLSADHWGESPAGLSPHAPYTTTPDLWRTIDNHTELRHRCRSVHLAESRAELELFTQDQGPLKNWLKSKGINQSWGQGHPVDLFDQHDVLQPGLLAIHGNLLDDLTVKRLSRKQVGLVHCPRSHAFFNHPPFPINACLKAGIVVALGTDSLASMPSPVGDHPFHLFHEIQWLMRRCLDISPTLALRMITLNAAKVLGMDKEVGSLDAGKLADWVTTPCQESPQSVEAWLVGSIPTWDRVTQAGRERFSGWSE